MKYFVLMLFLLNVLMAKDIAVVKSLNGEVTAKKDSDYISIHTGDSLDEKMVLMTKNSSVKIVFKDGSVLVLGPNSILNLSKFVFVPKEKEYDFKLFLQKGELSFESGKIGDLAPEKFSLKTPEGSIAIRGTKFFVKVQ